MEMCNTHHNCICVYLTWTAKMNTKIECAFFPSFSTVAANRICWTGQYVYICSAVNPFVQIDDIFAKKKLNKSGADRKSEIVDGWFDDAQSNGRESDVSFFSFFYQSCTFCAESRCSIIIFWWLHKWNNKVNKKMPWKIGESHFHLAICRQTKWNRMIEQIARPREADEKKTTTEINK